MLVSKFALLSIFVVICCLSVGCGDGRPDPRANPDFNEESMTDPGSVKLN